MIPGRSRAALLALLLAAWTGRARERADLQSKSPGQTTASPRRPAPAPREDPLAAFLRQAAEAIDQKKFSAAIDPLKRYLAARPDDAVAHFQLGYVYSGLRQSEAAKSEYLRALALNPKLAAAHLNLGLELLDSDPASAVDPFRRAAELEPNQSRPRFLVGLAMERTHNLPAAIEEYQAARRLDPNEYEIAFALGRALLSAGRAAEAEAEFRAALGLGADKARARLGVANSLVAQKRLEPAAEEYAAYLNERPQDREARVGLVAVLIDLKRYPDALKELDRADAGLAPSVETSKLRAEAWSAQGQWKQAAEALEKTLALAPLDAELHARRGRLALALRDFPTAERELRLAIKIAPESHDPLRDLVSVFYLSENYQAALDALDLLGRQETLAPGSWFIRATCYDKLERKAEALDAYEKFIALDQKRSDKEDFQARYRIRILHKELDNKRKR